MIVINQQALAAYSLRLKLFRLIEKILKFQKEGNERLIFIVYQIELILRVHHLSWMKRRAVSLALLSILYIWDALRRDSYLLCENGFEHERIQSW